MAILRAVCFSTILPILKMTLTSVSHLFYLHILKEKALFLFFKFIFLYYFSITVDIRYHFVLLSGVQHLTCEVEPCLDNHIN